MRRLRARGLKVCAAFGLILSLLLIPTACQRKKKRSRVEAISKSYGLSSMIEVADPRADLQLVKGFYGVESGAWRWTAGSFSVILRPPGSAAQKGATLILRLVIPDAVIEKLKTIRLFATVNGLPLAPEEYSKPGNYVYSRDVPSTALLADAVSVNFTLDKFLPASPSDHRDLGVIVSVVGFEAK